MLPTDAKVFLDVFGGSATVSANVDYPIVRYNELDSYMHDLVKLSRDTDPDRLVRDFNKIVKKYNLSRINEDQYYKFRKAYNKNPCNTKLFVLAKHSFSSQIRFSKQGFDMPFGKRGGILSNRLINTFKDFHDNIQSVRMSKLGAASFVKKCIDRYSPKDCIFYFDPPYLASGANVYRNKWTEDHEKEFLKLLDYLNKKGYRFMLSNVFKHKHHTNKLLKKWSKQYNVYYPKFAGKGEGYVINRAAVQGANNTVEVLITNY